MRISSIANRKKHEQEKTKVNRKTKDIGHVVGYRREVY
jgi:hypothetical protein